MTDKLKYFFISIAAILVLAGCDGNSNGSWLDGKSVDGADYVLAGYYMMAGEEEALSDTDSGTSRATASTDVTRYSDYNEKTFTDLAGTTMRFVNYPEQGQKTYTTVTATGDPDIFKFSSRTEYPNREDVIDYYLEEYYLKDATGTGSGTDYWYEEGVVVDDAGDEDATFRETMEVHFQDGSVRYEWITDTSTTMGTYYSPFDYDGDMSIPSDEDWAPDTTDTGMAWSSKVHYYQNVQADIGWFTVENKEIFGVRYYTEDDDGDSSCVAYEHMISSESISTGIVALDSLAEWIFGGGDSGDATLAETVIRYELTGSNNRKTTRSQTEIVDSFGNTLTIDMENEY